MKVYGVYYHYIDSHPKDHRLVVASMVDKETELAVMLEPDQDNTVIGRIRKSDHAVDYDLNEGIPKEYGYENELRELKRIFDIINNNKDELEKIYVKKGPVEIEGFELDVFFGSLGIVTNTLQID